MAVAGRVMARRFMGKLAFLALSDGSGAIQVYLDRAVVDEAQPEAFRCAAGSNTSLCSGNALAARL